MSKITKYIGLWLSLILFGDASAGGGATLGAISPPISGLVYSTSFTATENPISEGGAWTLGGTTGLDWQNPRTTTGSPNKAYGSGFTDGSAGYNDNIAVLSGFPANQSAQVTIFRQVGYAPTDGHEVELLLRFQITANVARGYEVDLWFGGSQVQTLRWNGALNDVVDIGGSGTGISSLVTGDVVKATMVGTTLTVYKNGTSVWSVTDATYSTGNPGMGFFIRPGGTLSDYCISQFTAAGLP
jgi:hypothetical protein